MLANIPATQTVIEIKAPGGPEMLVPATRPVPEPKAGEVLIRIAAAGVNRADCLQRMGRYPMPPGAPDIPGLECSGTVVQTGEGVSEWRAGDEVCALLIADGYGEYAAAPAAQCLPVPAGVNLVDAGGLPETFTTVWTNVFERMHLEAGEVFLVQGGTSGIGITAIQLAKAFGAQVLATAGSDEKCHACRDYGADVAINYRTQDFAQVGKEFTQGRGVDAILDMVGGNYIPAQLELLAQEGRLCFVALMQGSRVEADFGQILRKHLTVTGSTLRPRTIAQKAGIIAQLKEKSKDSAKAAEVGALLTASMSFLHSAAPIPAQNVGGRRSLTECQGDFVMPWASWQGFLRLSLVTCPVYLSPATTRTKSIRLHQVWQPEPVNVDKDELPDRSAGLQGSASSALPLAADPSNPEADQSRAATRITLRPHDPGTGEEIDKREVVKGYEHGRGQFVTLTPEELKALDVESSKVIDLEKFVPRGDLDPVCFDSSCYLYPDYPIAVERLRVIGAAIAEAGVVGLGRLTLSRRERMVVVEPCGAGMALFSLRAAEEVRAAQCGMSEGELDAEMVAIARRSSRKGPEVSIRRRIEIVTRRPCVN